MANFTKNYVKHTYVDGQAPYLSASNLNETEEFIKELDNRTKELKNTKIDNDGSMLNNMAKARADLWAETESDLGYLTTKTNECKNLINETASAAISTIDEKVDDGIAELESKCDSETERLNEVGNAEVTLIQNKSQEKITAIQNKGDEVLASIPKDYTQVISDVDSLKVGKVDKNSTTSTIMHSAQKIYITSDSGGVYLNGDFYVKTKGSDEYVDFDDFYGNVSTLEGNVSTLDDDVTSLKTDKVDKESSERVSIKSTDEKVMIYGYEGVSIIAGSSDDFKDFFLKGNIKMYDPDEERYYEPTPILKAFDELGLTIDAYGNVIDEWEE